MTKKHKTFQQQFELLDDIPCMAATFEFLADQDIHEYKLSHHPHNAIMMGFSWANSSTHGWYWNEQYEILRNRLNKQP